MKYHEKIKQFRKQQQLTITDIYERGITIFGPHKAISISTIKRIENGKPHKFSSLRQYCDILGLTLNELFKGTEFEERLVIKRKERINGYVYDEKAYSSVINNPNQSFLAQEVTLEPSGKTILDHAPRDRGKSDKMVYIIRGNVMCHIETEMFELTAGDSLSFDGTKRHYFENAAKTTTKFIVVENPGRY